jgi:hypothetical protein
LIGLSAGGAGEFGMAKLTIEVTVGCFFDGRVALASFAGVELIPILVGNCWKLYRVAFVGCGYAAIKNGRLTHIILTIIIIKKSVKSVFISCHE